MKRVFQLAAAATRHLLAVFGSFALWTLWLGLVLLLALQLYILSSSELAVPKFALRELETRLAASGLRATFGRTSFDPTGRILVENVRLSLPNFPDPVVTARSIYVRVNPWFLAVGRFEPREVRVVDASAAVPAMLSPTGRPAEIITHVDATVEPGRSFLIHQLSGRVAGAVVSARGTLVVPRRPGKPIEDVIADFVRNRFPLLCRQALQVAEYVKQLEEPELHLELTPSESGAAAMNVTLLARHARLAPPISGHASGLRVRTRFLLLGDNAISSLQFAATQLELPGKFVARGVQGDVYGRFQDGAFFFEPRELTLTADAVAAAGFEAQALSTQVFPRPLPRIDVAAVARVIDAPLAVRAEADLREQHARVGFDGRLSPGLLTPLNEHLRVDVRKYFDFTQLAVERGEVRLGDGWQFQKLDARVRVDGINAYGIKMTDGRVTLSLDPRRFYAPHAFARVGENFARGSYEHDLRTHEYRFLLQGRLRPLEISEWFRGDWWSDFFRQLEFPTAPPAADVDVRGIWREGQGTSVYVFADADKTLARGTEFDRVRTRMFIRPGFFDALELSATRGEGLGRGRFTFVDPPGTAGWKSFDLAFESSLDLATLGKITGPVGAHVLAPFTLSQPPELKIGGRFTGPGSEKGEHEELRVEARTSGDFRYHQFPLQNTSFVATLRDDELSIDDFEALLAGGVALGHARVWGPADQRRLGFDFTLNEASLGQVVGTLQGFFAQQKGLPPPPPGKFVQEKANVNLNLSVSAEGLYSDPRSFRGEGNATLHGPEIAELPLLGSLSELLKFTSLRFTDAQTNFKIEGPRITFPEVKFRGASAAIDAHGSYALERRELDFNAKIFPFQESENLIKSVVGVVLNPLSNVFEVKLTGTLENPEWSLTLAPGNLLRSLTPGDSEPKSPPPPAPAK